MAIAAQPMATTKMTHLMAAKAECAIAHQAGNPAGLVRVSKMKMTAAIIDHARAAGARIISYKALYEEKIKERRK